MNIKYSTSEMGFEGYFPVNYPNLRVLETQLLYLEAYHLPIQKIITEGRNRQILKIADNLGNKVFDLKRIRIATIELNGLNQGSWRELHKCEWEHLLT